MCSLALADFTADVLRRETGTRALGMGGAFTAVAEDTSAFFYNPAGLAKPGFQFSYSEIDTNHKDGIRKSAENGFKLGNVGYFHGKYINDELDFVQFDSWGFGVRTPLGLDYGLVFKRVIQENPDNRGSGWGADIGTIIHLTEDLKLGLTAQNFSAGNLDLKPSYRIGVSKTFDKLRLVYDHETFNPYDSPNTNQAHSGLEWDVIDGFTVRTGFNDKHPTYGLSLGIFGLIFDYAVEHKDREILYSFAAKLGNEREPKIREYAVFKKKEFLLLDLSMPVVPGQSEYSVFGGLSIGADYLTSKIRMAAEDKDIAGIVIKIGDLPNSISYVGLIQELRQELVRFKAKGKTLIVYVEGEISANTYYLVSCADKIVMSKMGAVYALGKSVTVTRMTGLLDKLGLQAETIKSGEYKDALSPFNPQFTEKQREHIEQLVFDVNEQVMSEIRAARKLTTSNIAELKDGGIIPADQALSYGLIDEIAYADKVKEFCRKVARLDHDPELIKITDLPAYELDQDLLPNFNTIAVVDIDGEIVTGKTKDNFLFGGKSVGAESVIEELKKIEERDDVKAVVLRINSPGGSALASDMIYEQVMKLKDKKKYIVASLGNVAASGGYYIAAAADLIVANKGTLTGSIGVIGQMLKGGKLLENIGVKQETIKTGEHMDMESFGRDFTEREREMLFKYQNKIYEDFKLIVAKSRDIHIEDVEKLAQGKIYSGAKAKELKLVDDFGTFYDAIDKAKSGAKISGKAKIIRVLNVEDYGWLVARSRFASMLGLDSLNLKNMLKQDSFAEFQSFIY